MTIVSLAQRFGARIRELREARGLRRSDLAQALDVSEQAIGRIERGERMNPQNFEALAEALGVDVRDLFDFGAASAPRARLSPATEKIAALVEARSRRDPSFARRVLAAIRGFSE